MASVVAMIDALRAEVLEAGPGSERNVSRLGLVLGEASAEELQDRLWELAKRVRRRAARSPTAQRFGVFIAMHERP